MTVTRHGVPGRTPRRAAPHPDDLVHRLVPDWLPPFFVVCAVALVPWAVWTALRLPERRVASHWALAWGGFDVGLAVLLAGTGLALARRSVLAEILAGMTGTLLICDAWFDVLTSRRPADVAVSVAEALCCELPLAGICLWIAARLARSVDTARAYLRESGFRVENRRLVAPESAIAGLGAEVDTGQHWKVRIRRPPDADQLLFPWWMPAAFVGLGVVLVPWIAWLLLSLPQHVLAGHWDAANSGLEAALVVLLLATGVGFARRSSIGPVLAGMTAALLLRNAWFDPLTSGRHGHPALAFVAALGFELPLAAVCLWTAVSHARLMAVARPYLLGAGFRVSGRRLVAPAHTGP